MTSILPVDDRRLKIKGQDEKTPGDDSTRAFLNFSRENLNISQSDIEQGFNNRNSLSKCFKINRQTALSLFAIALLIVCIAFEMIEMQKSLREIELIKSEILTLKRQFDIQSQANEDEYLAQLRSFEQQYAEMYGDENDDSSEIDIDGDYSSNYDDDDINQDDYLDDYKLTPGRETQNTTENLIGLKDEGTLFNSSGVEHNGTIILQHNKRKRHIDEQPSQKMYSRDNKLHLNKSRTTGTTNKKYYNGKYKQLYRKSLKKHGMSRRHIRPSRQIFAAHYGADSSLFHETDEHTGNGRAKHNEGIFKAWRSSNWMDDLGMNRYFSLARNGRLTIHETGLYIVYAQIHYLDEHDENGFHMLVNGQPILQCMVYSPGSGHKSRSCFSAQVTYLTAGDHIILKDVGPARYTLFQSDKSFFGLAKIGDTRQSQQQYQMRHNMSIQPQTTTLP